MSLLAAPALRSVSDLLEQLGNVPPDRVLMQPAPGTATVEDVVQIHSRHGILCELVDATLVEKGRGIRESILAGALIATLREFVLPLNLGIVTGESGMMRLMAGLVRIPDVAFISWDRLPGRKIPSVLVPQLAPNLAVEIFSRSNTPGEMRRKLVEYFQCGVNLVWLIDPERRVVEVYRQPDEFSSLSEADVLEGGDVLSGWSKPLRELFSELDRQGR